MALTVISQIYIFLGLLNSESPDGRLPLHSLDQILGVLTLSHAQYSRPSKRYSLAQRFLALKLGIDLLKLGLVPFHQGPTLIGMQGYSGQVAATASAPSVFVPRPIPTKNSLSSKS